MDPFTVIPDLAKDLGIAPSTLVFLIVVANVVCRAITRSIPDTATGWRGFVRQLTAIVGVEVANKVAPGVTGADVAKATLATSPKVAAVVAEAKDDRAA